VPHGCGGAATTRIRVQVPPVFTSAKPQPKAGWTTEVAARTSIEHTGSVGHDQAGAPREIAWSGRLEEGSYDEFVIWVSTSRTQEPATIFVPVLQECGSTVERWIEIPAAGGKSDDLKSPAPSFKLTRPQ
ncbi:MAG: YcnI family protein, partial [Microvirga sp.]